MPTDTAVSLTFTLTSLEETTTLARRLINGLLHEPKVRTLLLRGPLGSGKTTLTRALVSQLAGKEQAEISSPSFTVCNHYPTTPPVLHCDLYRVGSRLPDELFEAWENTGADRPWVIIEWAEYILEHDLPQEYLDILLQPCQEIRSVTVEPHGPRARCASQHLTKDLSTPFLK
ncbi:MAG: tRNA (adenosine(37)-N6)-threonylcarbamoyltransferase complex ATPase subunit type 1 TsaE [Desulfovibrionaceae bacterium]